MLDTVFDRDCGGTLYKYYDKTNKVLRMSRVAITEKNVEETENVETQEDTSKFAITKTYEEALSLFLHPGRRAPRKIPENMNGLQLIDQSNRLTIKDDRGAETSQAAHRRNEGDQSSSSDDAHDSDYVPFEERQA